MREFPWELIVGFGCIRPCLLACLLSDNVGNAVLRATRKDGSVSRHRGSYRTCRRYPSKLPTQILQCRPSRRNGGPPRNECQSEGPSIHPSIHPVMADAPQECTSRCRLHGGLSDTVDALPVGHTTMPLDMEAANLFHWECRLLHTVVYCGKERFQKCLPKDSPQALYIHRSYRRSSSYTVFRRW